MRFIKDGPNLPNELLFAHDKGQVVFFCGAGVSMANAKLPGFLHLAEMVMEDLGESEDSKARKLLSAFHKFNDDPHTRGIFPVDQIFSSLKRSFDNKDIDNSIAKCLSTQKKTNLSAHKTILKLAKLRGGQTRLITTNFDLLFEEACNNQIESVTRSNFPHIKYSDNDWGIVHLHGKVDSHYSGSDKDGFVLSSSEFGDAYVSQGWAKNFIKDVLDKYIAVFIGYTADDPPIKYLLEGLQQSNGFKHKAYAFQPGPNEEAVEQWREKGVEALVYKECKEKSHDELWKTLKAWSIRGQDPVKWKQKILKKGSEDPKKLLPHERGMIAHLVNSQSGAKLFMQQEFPMSSEWLCVFDNKIRLGKPVREGSFFVENKIIDPYQLYALDDDAPKSLENEEYEKLPNKEWNVFDLNQEDYESLESNKDNHFSSIRGYNSNHILPKCLRLYFIARWLVNVADQRISVWWAGKQTGLHPEILKNIERRMTDKNNPLTGVTKDAWEAVIELNRFTKQGEFEDYELKDYIKATGWSQLVVRKYAKVTAPFLKNDSRFNNFISRDNRKKISNRSLVEVDVNYPEGHQDIQVPDDYLVPILDVLRINMEMAVDFTQKYSCWMDFSSIEPDDDLRGQESIRNYGLSGYVLHFSKLFKRLIEVDIKKAKIEYNKWKNTHPIFTRLRIWAVGQADIVSEEEFVNEILSLDGEYFWPFNGERDLLLSLRNRWNTLTSSNRILIENKILERLPKSGSNNLEHQKRTAFSQLNRLHWLKDEGCQIILDLDKLTKELVKISPDWKPAYAQKAAESHDGRCGWVTTNTDCDALKSIPLAEILEKAELLRGRDSTFLTEHNPFAGLCAEAPLKALGAMSLQLKKGDFSSHFWETYLSSACRKEDSFRLKLLTGGRITQIPNVDFKQIMLIASRWFEDFGPELREQNEQLFNKIWNKFIKVIRDNDSYSGSALIRQEEKKIDWATEAKNSPSGILAKLLMTDESKSNLKVGKGFPESWIGKVEELIGLPNDANRYAMVIFAFNLSWFYAIDPKWTDDTFINILEDGEIDKKDREAFWSGYMWGAKIPNEGLCVRLKQHFLEMAVDKVSENKKDVATLSGILLAGWGSKNKSGERYILNADMHKALLNSDESFRSQTLWHLERWSKNKENSWNKKILEFLKEVWPKYKKLRTNKIIEGLCNVALIQDENFPEISKQVSKLVSKAGNEYLHIYGIHNDENNLASKYPEELLNLLYAILPDRSEFWPHGTRDILIVIEETSPRLLNDPSLIELKSRLNED